MARLFGRIGNERGSTAEEVFFSVFECGQPLPAWLYDVVRPAPNRKDFDAIAETDAGKVFVQIKSSGIGKREFKRKKHATPAVVVVVRLGESVEVIRSRALSIIGQERHRLLGSGRN